MAEANRDAAEQWAVRASAALREGDVSAALRFAEKSLKLNPDDNRVLELRSRAQAAAVAAAAGGGGGGESPAASSPATPGSGRATSPPASRSHHAGRADGLRGTGATPGVSAAPSTTADGQPRARPAARPSGGAAASRAHAPPVRPHTPEQAAVVRAIKAAADYYEVLGVAKDASADDIKRVRRRNVGRVSVCD